MAVNITYVDSYKHYGKCVKLENDKIELLVTTELGPRIIYFAQKGGENVFFNDDDDSRVDKSPFYKQLFGENEAYHFYGGHRMWLAPQQMVHTESPDNVPVKCKEIKNGVVLTCPEAKVIGFISEMTVVMDEEKPEITVTAEFENTSDEPKKHAVWQVTQCAPGGVAFFPFTTPFRPRKPFNEMTLEDLSAPLVPSGSIFMFVGAFTDKRLKVDDSFITLEYSPEKQRPIKIGSQDTQGWAMYANKGNMLKIEFEHDKNGTYTDGGCSLESYTDASFVEVETLGQYKEYKKGERISHTEKISIMSLKTDIPDISDREAVKEFINLHL